MPTCAACGNKMRRYDGAESYTCANCVLARNGSLRGAVFTEHDKRQAERRKERAPQVMAGQPSTQNYDFDEIFDSENLGRRIAGEDVGVSWSDDPWFRPRSRQDDNGDNHDIPGVPEEDEDD